MNRTRAIATDAAGEIIDFVVKRHEALSRPLVMGISGIECSGKSTLSSALGEKLARAGFAVHIESIDDFLTPTALRHAGKDLASAYYESTFRSGDLAEQIIKPLVERGRIEGYADRYDFSTDRVVSLPIRTGPVDILIVEGVFLFRPPLRDLLDLRIWVDISFEHALERAMSRKLELDRYGQDHIAKRYRERYFPAQQRHLERDRPQAFADHVFSATALAGRTEL